MAANRTGGEKGGVDWVFALFAAFVAATVVRGVLARAPAGIRGLLAGGAAGGVAWLFSALLGLVGVAAVLGLLYGLMSVPKGRYARDSGWGGGSGGSSGGGWSGGGGMSGGGGASGSW